MFIIDSGSGWTVKIYIDCANILNLIDNKPKSKLYSKLLNSKKM